MRTNIFDAGSPWLDADNVNLIKIDTATCLDQWLPGALTKVRVVIDNPCGQYIASMPRGSLNGKNPDEFMRPYQEKDYYQ